MEEREGRGKMGVQWTERTSERERRGDMTFKKCRHAGERERERVTESAVGSI